MDSRRAFLITSALSLAGCAINVSVTPLGTGSSPSPVRRPSSLDTTLTHLPTLTESALRAMPHAQVVQLISPVFEPYIDGKLAPPQAKIVDDFTEFYMNTKQPDIAIDFKLRSLNTPVEKRDLNNRKVKEPLKDSYTFHVGRSTFKMVGGKQAPNPIRTAYGKLGEVKFTGLQRIELIREGYAGNFQMSTKEGRWTVGTPAQAIPFLIVADYVKRLDDGSLSDNQFLHSGRHIAPSHLYADIKPGPHSSGFPGYAVQGISFNASNFDRPSQAPK